MFNLRDLKCCKSATLWSTNHFWTIKAIERLSKNFFWVFGNSLPSVRWFFVSTIWTPPPSPPPTLEGHIWLISSSFSPIQLSAGAQIVGLQSLFGHEIQRSTLQKFADLWDTKCSVTGLATLSVPIISITNLLNETHKERVFSDHKNHYKWWNPCI